MLETLKETFNTNNPPDKEGEIRELFRERETDFSLIGVFQTPYANTEGEPTIAFPISVQTRGGVPYTRKELEFRIPDNGTNDDDSALVKFLTRALNVDTSDVSVDDVLNVAGTEVEVSLGEHGGYNINYTND